MDMLWIIGAIVFVFWLSGLKIIDQFERGVVFTLGKYSGTKDPGLNWLFPGFQRMIKVDLRTATMDIPKQEVITKDNVSAVVNAVVYFKVDSAEKSVLNIQDFRMAVAQYAQAALRDVVGGVELNTLLSERVHISEEIKRIVDETTVNWGVDVTDIKMQDIELPNDMKRVMAKKAESEREKQAIVIRAEGEKIAAETLVQAAEVLSRTPYGITMRSLQVIEKATTDPAKTIIFALPMELMQRLPDLGKNFADKI